MYEITTVHADGSKKILRSYNRELLFRNAAKLENVVYYKLIYRPIGKQ